MTLKNCQELLASQQIYSVKDWAMVAWFWDKNSAAMLIFHVSIRALFVHTVGNCSKIVRVSRILWRVAIALHRYRVTPIISGTVTCERATPHKPRMARNERAFSLHLENETTRTQAKESERNAAEAARKKRGAGTLASETETVRSNCSWRRGSPFGATPAVAHMSEVCARLCSMEFRFWIGLFRKSPACCTGHGWMRLAFESPFELTGARLVASELTNNPRHRLIWPLAGTEPTVWTIWISELTGVELTSFFAAVTCCLKGYYIYLSYTI